MKKLIVIITLAIFYILASTIGCRKAQVNLFTLQSTEISTIMTQAQYANGFGGCTGENKSPQLNWIYVPAGTKSFAITIFDRDANSGAGFHHWLVIDIPVTTVNLFQDAGNLSVNKLPKGAIQTQTDAMLVGYVGVCPPEKQTHHYEITVYAVNTNTLGLSSTASPATVKSAIASKSLGEATIVVTASN